MRTGLSSRARTPATQPDARSLEVDRQLRDAAIRAAPGEHWVDPVAVGGWHDNPEQVAPRRADRIAGLRGGDDLLHQGAGRLVRAVARIADHDGAGVDTDVTDELEIGR